MKRNFRIKALLSVIMLISVMIVPFSAASVETVANTSASTISDEEMAKLIEESKLDKGDKTDDNIFTFEIVGLEEINKRILEASDPKAESEKANEEGFSVNFAIASDELKEGETVTDYSIVVTDRSGGDYKSEANKSNGFTVEKLVIGTVYLISANVTVKTDNGEENRTYVGTFGIGCSENYTYYREETVIDVTKAVSGAETAEYINSRENIPIGEAVSVKTESKTNVYSVTSDTDGFVNVVLYTPDGNGGSSSLRIVKGSGYEDYENAPVYASSSSNDGRFEFVRFYAYEGETFTVIADSLSEEPNNIILYTVTITLPVWFPQWQATVDNDIYWDDTFLTSLKFDMCDYWDQDGDGNTSELVDSFFTDNAASGVDYMAKACTSCAIAMILKIKNKNATSMFDIRTKTIGTVSGNADETIIADPYSLFLVIHSLSGNEFSYTNNVYRYNGTLSPFIDDWDLIYDKFGITKDSTNSSSSYTPNSYDALATRLSTLLSVHPEGVYLFFSNHTIVVRKIGSAMRVFDPGTTWTYGSDSTYYYNVPLYTYFNTYAVRSISGIRGYNTYN